MSDLIDRDDALDAVEFGITYARVFNKETGEVRELFQESNDELRKAVERIKQLPTIQPDNGLQKLADEIASFKRCFKSENGDYLTGYLSALSVVEGMIADMREVVQIVADAPTVIEGNET